MFNIFYKLPPPLKINKLIFLNRVVFDFYVPVVIKKKESILIKQVCLFIYLFFICFCLFFLYMYFTDYIQLLRVLAILLASVLDNNSTNSHYFNILVDINVLLYLVVFIFSNKWQLNFNRWSTVKSLFRIVKSINIRYFMY